MTLPWTLSNEGGSVLVEILNPTNQKNTTPRV